MPGTLEHKTSNNVNSSNYLLYSNLDTQEYIFDDKKRRTTSDNSTFSLNKRVMSMEYVRSSSSTDELDTNLYSRQIGAFGLETMGRLIKLKYLVWGLNGPGLETAKNLILSGPHTVDLCDDTVVSKQEYAYNFLLTDQDIENKLIRSAVAQKSLKELNEYVKVQDISEKEAHTSEVLSQYDVVILSGHSLLSQIQINNQCRALNKRIGFIAINTFGLACSLFVDFGHNFTIFDELGEPSKDVIIENITQGAPGVVYINEEKRCPFSTGNYVTFREVEGMEELNNCEPVPIIVTGPYSFSICDTTNFSQYLRQGIATRVNKPKHVNFTPLEKILETPVPPGECSLLQPDLAKPNRAEQLYYVFRGIFQYQKMTNKLPDLNDSNAAVELCFQYASQFNEKSKTLQNNERDLSTEHAVVYVESLDKTLFEKIVPYCKCDISPIASFIGGIASQEAMKFTGKFKPLQQFLFFDSTETLLPDTRDRMVSNSRYDHYTALFGEQLQRDLGKLKLFLVGAGALGCELIKGLALMGCSTKSGKGCLTLTDMDNIEISNLNRQFLFRRSHVGKSKSKIAAQKALSMNPDINIEPHETRVGTDTEEEFDDTFWENLDIVINALDNINSRLYIDSKCVWYEKPLLESGTLGTRANTQVILPKRTQSYGDSRDPPEESIPLCTLRHFPNQIEHTIEWARDIFQGLFCDSARETQIYLQNPAGYLANLKNEGGISVQKARLENIYRLLKLLSENNTIEACLNQAIENFTEYFHYNIAQLLHNFPLDHVTSNGQLFWSGPKRPPTPIEFSTENPLHLEFVRAATNLMAFICGIEQTNDLSLIKSLCQNIKIKPFVPRVFHFRISEDDTTTEGSGNDEYAVISLESQISKLIEGRDTLELYNKIKVVEFEKDDDTNYHIDFILTCANLRAENYKIPKCDFHKAKLIAGKIIPAIATTTAAITGLVLLELIKIINEKKRPLEDFKNAFLCLGTQFYCMTEPMPALKTVSKDYDSVVCGPLRAIPSGFTTWDKLEIKIPNAKIQQVLDALKQLGVDVSVLSMSNICVYNSFVKSHRQRLNLNVKELIESINKKPLPPKRKYVALEVSGSDNEGVDVILPTIKLIFSF